MAEVMRLESTGSAVQDRLERPEQLQVLKPEDPGLLGLLTSNIQGSNSQQVEARLGQSQAPYGPWLSAPTWTS